ncbi:hypothetical protein EDB19DRAFT_1734064 [Suillus lakei]|nr:hypothetical protein EDB19DRAFT_1734064 [Suillus lakei]
MYLRCDTNPYGSGRWFAIHAHPSISSPLKSCSHNQSMLLQTTGMAKILPRSVLPQNRDRARPTLLLVINLADPSHRPQGFDFPGRQIWLCFNCCAHAFELVWHRHIDKLVNVVRTLNVDHQLTPAERFGLYVACGMFGVGIYLIYLPYVPCSGQPLRACLHPATPNGESLEGIEQWSWMRVSS